MYFQEQPIAKIEGNALYFYHNDHLGTPIMMTDQNKTIVWQGEHLPFGEPLSVTGTTTNNLRFPGQYYDTETGLHYNYFRDYMPEIGRYVEKDPVGLKGGINLWAHVANNPVNYIDPLGLTDLFYNNTTGTLTIQDGDGNTIGEYPAANNASQSGNGPFPSGTYDFSHYVPHSGSNADSAYGSHGNFVFNVPGRPGMGVHSGRANRCDRANRCGTQHATEGCIRTTDDATDVIRQYHQNGDAVRTITVVR